MPLDGFCAGGESVPREEPGQQAVHGGLAGVKRLAHRPVHHFHACRLGGAGSERSERLFG